MSSAPTDTAHRAPRRVAARLGVLTAAVVLLLSWGAGAAAAHVTVDPGTASAGSYAVLTLRVPTESETASTVSVTVTLPNDHPFPSVSVMQLPGWTSTITRTRLDPPVVQGRFTLTQAVTAIAWTADDGVGIKPGEFMQFPISVGPVPDVASMQFPAVQTYSDGSVVRWDQPRAANGDQPEHPAPLLTISDPTGGSAAAGGAATIDDDGAYRSTAIVAEPDTTARILGAIALVLAALALFVAVLGVRRRNRPEPRR